MNTESIKQETLKNFSIFLQRDSEFTPEEAAKEVEVFNKFLVSNNKSITELTKRDFITYSRIGAKKVLNRHIRAKSIYPTFEAALRHAQIINLH
ncbi:hypothetical protein QX249_09935 [Vibrio parahaemolyticus]|uniref:Chromosome partitioning protein ParA n=1 Tax=Vibrio parahaemolyticus TaxID=670 RepID=A0AAW8PXK5_VIBPH|nr:hypothetical protein [Vibrio parahaemolyticus]EGR2229582.1 hypothetical protein [Vibrio parahaemolyticus]MDS1820977.1 hypothetical protein [Vibrio parahaemolyticus]